MADYGMTNSSLLKTVVGQSDILGRAKQEGQNFGKQYTASLVDIPGGTPGNEPRFHKDLYGSLKASSGLSGMENPYHKSSFLERNKPVPGGEGKDSPLSLSIEGTAGKKSMPTIGAEFTAPIPSLDDLEPGEQTTVTKPGVVNLKPGEVVSNPSKPTADEAWARQQGQWRGMVEPFSAASERRPAIRESAGPIFTDEAKSLTPKNPFYRNEAAPKISTGTKPVTPTPTATMGIGDTIGSMEEKPGAAPAGRKEVKEIPGGRTLPEGVKQFDVGPERFFGGRSGDEIAKERILAEAGSPNTPEAMELRSRQEWAQGGPTAPKFTTNEYTGRAEGRVAETPGWQRSLADKEAAEGGFSYDKYKQNLQLMGVKASSKMGRQILQHMVSSAEAAEERKFQQQRVDIERQKAETSMRWENMQIEHLMKMEPGEIQKNIEEVAKIKAEREMIPVEKAKVSAMTDYYNKIASSREFSAEGQRIRELATIYGQTLPTDPLHVSVEKEMNQLIEEGRGRIELQRFEEAHPELKGKFRWDGKRIIPIS